MGEMWSQDKECMLEGMQLNEVDAALERNNFLLEDLLPKGQKLSHCSPSILFNDY